MKLRYSKYFPLIIISFGLLAYANSFNGVFLFDDYSVIVDNPRVHGLSPMILYPRILTEYTFKLNYMFAGLNPADYHAVNLLIHIVSGLLLYGIIRRTLLMPVIGTVWRERSSLFALVVSSIWLIHPLQTESVTYICQRYESMAGLFYFLTLYYFIRGLQSWRRKRGWYDFSLFACIIGMGCKDIIVTAPVVIFIYDYTFSGESVREIFKVRWKIYLALFMMWGIYACLFLGGWTAQIMEGQSVTADISPWVYLLNQCEVILYYLRLSVIPYPLCLDYGWALKDFLLPLILSGVIITMLGFASLCGLYRKSSLGFLGAWFFIVLAPTSSIIPLPDLAFEHRMYLPLVSVISTIIALIFIAGDKIRNKNIYLYYKKIFSLFFIIISGFFIFLTLNRNKLYGSRRGIWDDVVKREKINFRANYSLASSLIKAGEFSEGINTINSVLAIIRKDIERGRKNRIIARNALYYLPRIYNLLGNAYLGIDDIKQSIKFFKEAIRWKPDNGEYYLNLAVALYYNADNKVAMMNLQKARELIPSCGDIYEFTGRILTESGKFEEAVNNYEKAITYSPDLIFSQCELAWLLATSPQDDLRDGSRALKLSYKVCEKTNWKSVRALDVLAASYAETGDFSNAVNFAKGALELAKNSHSGSNKSDDNIEVNMNTSSVSNIALRLKMYRQGHQFRINDAKKL